MPNSSSELSAGIESHRPLVLPGFRQLIEILNDFDSN